MDDEIKEKENFSNKNINISNEKYNFEINNDINIDQEVINQDKGPINSFHNQYSLEQNNDKNIEEININTNIINNGYDSNSCMKFNQPNKFNNNNYDKVNLENQNLKKQLIELMSENQNLQTQINNHDYEYSPFYTDDNSNKYNYINNKQMYNMNLNSYDKFEQEMKLENDNDINFNNIMTPSYKNQKYVDDSIESIIKTNMNLSPKNKSKNIYKKNFIRNPNNNIHTRISKPQYNIITYEPIIPQNFKNIKIKTNKKNDIAEYFTNIDEYNELLEDYHKTKIKLESLKKEIEVKKSNSSKYKKLESNYKDLQKRNKDLVITIQKMKSDNLILTQYIDDLIKKKKIWLKMLLK